MSNKKTVLLALTLALVASLASIAGIAIVAAQGEWVPSFATLTGTVRNVTGDSVPNAVVSIVGTSLTATTGTDGTYTITGVPSGTYDIVASKPSDGYTDSTATGKEILAGTVTVDFALLRAAGNCNDDCTTIGSNRCSASCNGKGGCQFSSEETVNACDGTFGLKELPDGRYIECCEGQPYSPIKAAVSVPSKNVVKITKPVLYGGQLVKMVMLVFTPGN